MLITTFYQHLLFRYPSVMGTRVVVVRLENEDDRLDPRWITSPHFCLCAYTKMYICSYAETSDCFRWISHSSNSCCNTSDRSRPSSSLRRMLVTSRCVCFFRKWE